MQEMQETGFDPWVGKISWQRKWQPTPVFLPGNYHGERSLVGYSPWGCKELDTTEATESFPGGASGKEPTCQCMRLKKCWFDPPDQEDPLEGGVATHSSVLAWRIPWTEEPVRLQSIGSHRVGYA